MDLRQHVIKTLTEAGLLSRVTVQPTDEHGGIKVEGPRDAAAAARDALSATTHNGRSLKGRTAFARCGLNEGMVYIR